jgi:diphosphomevalonate decarboxylase
VKHRARARARANIALAKYWGKSDVALNLPAVPSISLTLDALVTDTSVTFDDALDQDEVWLDGARATGSAHSRVIELLERVRLRADLSARARIESKNRFPTAAGLASSASGFAALAAAATVAAGLPYREVEVSRLARRSSASAARSVHGGFVALAAGKPGDDKLAAKPLAPVDHWDVVLVVGLAAKGPKAVGSTEGMERSRRTSPLYDAWVERAPALTARLRRALMRRDLDALGRAMEQSTMSFHACALSSDPGILYFQPSTIAALRAIRALRDDAGVSVYTTMDAGPHVKALCLAKDARRVRRTLAAADGILGTIVAKPGRGVEVHG